MIEAVRTTQPETQDQHFRKQAVEIRERSNSIDWDAGKLASEWKAACPSVTDGDIAEELGQSEDWVQQRRKVWESYGSELVREIPWTFHLIARNWPDRDHWLQQAAQLGWSKQKMVDQRKAALQEHESESGNVERPTEPKDGAKTADTESGDSVFSSPVAPLTQPTIETPLVRPAPQTVPVSQGPVETPASPTATEGQGSPSCELNLAAVIEFIDTLPVKDLETIQNKVGERLVEDIGFPAKFDFPEFKACFAEWLAYRRTYRSRGSKEPLSCTERGDQW